MLFISQVETGTGGQSAVKGSSLFVSPLQQPCQLKRRIPPGRILSFDLPCPTMAAVSTMGMDSTRYNATKRPPMPRFDDVGDSLALLLCFLYVSWFFYLSPSFSLFIGFLRTKLYTHTCLDAQDAVYTEDTVAKPTVCVDLYRVWVAIDAPTRYKTTGRRPSRKMLLIETLANWRMKFVGRMDRLKSRKVSRCYTPCLAG